MRRFWENIDVIYIYNNQIFFEAFGALRYLVLWLVEALFLHIFVVFVQWILVLFTVLFFGALCCCIVLLVGVFEQCVCPWPFFLVLSLFFFVKFCKYLFVCCSCSVQVCLSKLLFSLLLPWWLGLETSVWTSFPTQCSLTFRLFNMFMSPTVWTFCFLSPYEVCLVEIWTQEMRDKFEGGVMGSDGCIYCIPLCLGSHELQSVMMPLGSLRVQNGNKTSWEDDLRWFWGARGVRTLGVPGPAPACPPWRFEARKGRGEDCARSCCLSRQRVAALSFLWSYCELQGVQEIASSGASPLAVIGNGMNIFSPSKLCCGIGVMNVLLNEIKLEEEQLSTPSNIFWETSNQPLKIFCCAIIRYPHFATLNDGKTKHLPGQRSGCYRCSQSDSV